MPSTIFALFLLLVFGTYGDQSAFTLGMMAMCLLFDVLAYAAEDARDPVSTSEQITRFATNSAVEIITLSIAHGMLYLHGCDMLGFGLLILPPFIAFFLLQHGRHTETATEAIVGTPMAAAVVNVAPAPSNQDLIEVQNAAIEDLADFTLEETRDMVTQHKEIKQNFSILRITYDDAQNLLKHQDQRNTELQLGCDLLARALEDEREHFQDFADTVLERERQSRKTARLHVGERQRLSDATTRVKHLYGLLSDSQIESAQSLSKADHDATRIAELGATSAKQLKDHETRMSLGDSTNKALREQLVSNEAKTGIAVEELKQKNLQITALSEQLEQSQNDHVDLTFSHAAMLNALGQELRRSQEQSHWMMHDMQNELDRVKQELSLARRDMAALKLNHELDLLKKDEQIRTANRDLDDAVRHIEDSSATHMRAMAEVKEELRLADVNLDWAKMEVVRLTRENSDLELENAEYKASQCEYSATSSEQSTIDLVTLPDHPMELTSISMESVSAFNSAVTHVTGSSPSNEEEGTCAKGQDRQSAITTGTEITASPSVEDDDATIGASLDTSNMEDHDLAFSAVTQAEIIDDRGGVQSPNSSASQYAEEVFEPGAATGSPIMARSATAKTFIPIPTGPSKPVSHGFQDQNGHRKRGNGLQTQLNKAYKKVEQKAGRQREIEIQFKPLGTTGPRTRPQQGSAMMSSQWSTANIDETAARLARTAPPPTDFANTQQGPNFGSYTTAQPIACATGQHSTYLGYNNGGRTYPPTPPLQEDDHVYGQGYNQQIPTGPRRAFIPLRGQDDDGNWKKRGGEQCRQRERFLNQSLVKKGRSAGDE
ncbi:hypothetical protein B0A48_13589 [Cryoendolithus antarcticus]|uniref:Uncharacterized protein n=1 Tax=Cryoendolithus antarcticus TaxID=1507870 RepID=A0A1V8SPS1_9PEZI|nr:hypothetical protein B0A48_13589 [Cryoendolithus antarcticus]